MLDSFHVPLVDDNNNFLAFGAVNLFEELFILLVNEDPLEMREESGASLGVPVNLVLVKALLSKGGGTHQGDLCLVIKVFVDPLRATPLESFYDEINQVHSGFVGKLGSCLVIEFSSHKVHFGTNLLGSLASILDFETGPFESKIMTKAEEASEESRIETESKNLKPLSARVVDVAF